jgi:serine/threonine-protein kinase
MSKGSSAAANRPKFRDIKLLVQGIIRADATGTIMRIGDQNNLGKLYAMKVVKRDEPADDLYVELARCHCEASAKVSHPALLGYYDFQTRRQWFKVVRAELLMEYVVGKSIDQLPDLELAHLVQIFRQAAAGLAHLHRREMRHGDLQPSHIMLTRSGEVKVLGYGLNLLSDPLRANFKFNRAYLAPEQAKAKAVSDKADIYSLGAVMYQAMTGQPANIGRRAEGELEKIPTPSRLNPAISPLMNNILVHCLQSQPDKRPASMYDLQLKLDEAAKEMGADEVSLKGLAIGEEKEG